MVQPSLPNFFNGTGPFRNFLKSNQNMLMGLGAGIDPYQPNLASSLRAGMPGAMQGRQIDTQAGLLAAQEADRQAGIQQTAQQQSELLRILQEQAPDLVPWVNAGRGDEAFNEFVRRTSPSAQAEPTDDISEYNFYANQELAAGRNPVPFQQWMNPPEAPSAPETRTIFDPATGRDQVVQWNPAINDWVPIGGVEAESGPLVSIDNNLGAPGINKFYETAMGNQADLMSGFVDAGFAAQRSLGQLTTLQTLLSRAPQGMEGALVSAAGSLGIEMGDATSDVQAAEAIISQLVPQQRPPGTGVMSDADLALYKRSLPQIINQPGGNQRILATMQAMVEYDIAIGEIAQKTLNFDEQGNPELTPQEARQQISALKATFRERYLRDLPGTALPPPEVGAIIDGYRFNGGDPADPNSYTRL